MRQEDFLKKLGIYARYLNQFLDEEDVPRILETIKDLEEIRKQAEKQGVQRTELPRRSP
jgi:hypothetical protein